jgi:hypothetical protein
MSNVRRQNQRVCVEEIVSFSRFTGKNRIDRMLTSTPLPLWFRTLQALLVVAMVIYIAFPNLVAALPGLFIFVVILGVLVGVLSFIAAAQSRFQAKDDQHPPGV